MHMTFWFGYDLKGFFLDSLNISSVAGLVTSCIVLFLLAVAYEAIKLFLSGINYRKAADRSGHGHRCRNGNANGNGNGRLATDRTGTTVGVVGPTKRTRWGLLVGETVCYTAEVVVGYLLMLVVMYYNGYMFIAVLLGMTVGYALLGPTSDSWRFAAARIRPKCGTCAESTPPTATTREGSEGSPETHHELQCCPPTSNDDSPTTSSTTISNIQQNADN